MAVTVQFHFHSSLRRFTVVTPFCCSWQQTNVYLIKIQNQILEAYNTLRSRGVWVERGHRSSEVLFPLVALLEQVLQEYLDGILDSSNTGD